VGHNRRMLRPAVRTVLADAAGRAPSADAWALLLVAAGVDEAKAASLPTRLGYVFHLGTYGERDVVAQLDAWGSALRVRAEPEVAEVVERAAARLRAEVERDPQPPPAAAPPAAAPPVPTPSAPPPPVAPAVAVTPTGPPPGRQRPRAGATHPGQPRPGQPRPGQPPAWPAPAHPPGARPVGPPATGARPTGGRAPRRARWPVVVGVAGSLVLLSCCLFGLVADLLGGGS
jgi:hypothetical protein